VRLSRLWIFFVILVLFPAAVQAQQPAIAPETLAVPESTDLRVLLADILATSMADHHSLRIGVGHFGEADDDRISVTGISVEGTDVKFEGLRLRNLSLIFGRTVIDLPSLLRDRRVRILESETGSTVDMVITQNDLNTFLKSESERLNIEDPLVELTPGKILFRGRCRWWFADASFSTSGKFFLKGDKQIHFAPSRIAIRDMSMPSFMVSKLVKRINPILSLEKFPLGISLGSVEIGEGLLKISSLATEKTEADMDSRAVEDKAGREGAVHE
jgi:hypothetical protein